MLLGGALAFSQPLLAAESTNPALQALFDRRPTGIRKRMTIWRKPRCKNPDGGAEQYPALYLLALYSQQSGSAADAAQWRARLSAVSPNDPHLTELDNARQLQSIPQAQLSLARQQARSGNIAAALQTGVTPSAATSRRRAWRQNII